MPPSTASRILNLFGPSDDFRSPLWTIRICPLIALVSIILAETVWPNGSLHGICIGMAVGQLVAMIPQAFLITDVTYKNNGQPSDVQSLHVTP